MRTKPCMLSGALVAAMVLAASVHLSLHAGQVGAAGQAQRILQATGVKGGLVVHLGCGDGTLTAALRASGSYLVHGLDADPDNVAKARTHIQAQGLYGPVSADRLRGARLPYTDGLVNLVVASGQCPVSSEEVARVLAPRGVVLFEDRSLDPRHSTLDTAASSGLEGWTKATKPRPGNIDDWTHYLYDATNNAVSRDTAVGPPHHLQWVGAPRFARSHDHLASVSACVSSGGRIFYIADEGPMAAVILPPKWSLVARDAFSGVVLWRRPIPVWEWHLRGFRSGPPEIARRLVAVGDTVYVTLGYGAPVSALDAATGKTLRTYGGTDGALEFVCAGGRLFVVASDGTVAKELAAAKRRRAAKIQSQRPGYLLGRVVKRLVALDAASGKLAWRKADADTSELMPTTVAVAGGRVYFQSPGEIHCLEAATGREVWRADRPTTPNRLAWTAPTLVVHRGVVLSADRAAKSVANKAATGDGQVMWTVSSAGGQAPPGQLIAYDARAGKRLWDCPSKECYNAPVDVLVAGGLVWTGNLVRATEPGITEGRDPLTGEVRKTRPKDGEFYNVGMNHHRCHRNKATSRFLVLGRAGVEFIDLASGKGTASHWTRGGCQYGVMPSNGLLYCPSHSCACYIEAKINGFNCLAPARKGRGSRGEVRADEATRLEKGPAFGALDTRTSTLDTSASWPTYRHDAARSGVTAAAVAMPVAERWQAPLGGRLTSVTVAEGKLFVAQIDAHTVHALHAADGTPAWRYRAGGRVDSPPTVAGGRVLFGSADGWVTCLRGSDGALAWRFLAAPEDRRVVAYGQLESAWPVHGSVLVQDGAACLVAGRSAYLDGGLTLYRLDVATGKVLTATRIDSRDPATGEERARVARGTAMPGTLPDVLSSDGTSLFMRHTRFDLEGQPQSGSVPHLFGSVGFLDDTWWHRTYWQWGTKMGSGYGGWPHTGNAVPAGRILAVAGPVIYGYGRDRYFAHGAHVGIDGASVFHFRPPHRFSTYRLFAAKLGAPSPLPAGGHRPPAGAPQPKAKAKARRRGPRVNRTFLWQQPVPISVRAMVLAGDTLFVAGPQDPVGDARGTYPDAPARWRASPASGAAQGARLLAVSTADGKPAAELPLAAAPVWDGMVAAGGRLYLATLDGKVLCLGKSQ